jgi:RHS repeat-associated protein
MQGQYDDGEIGLYYNTFRYYDYDAARFAAEDPIGLAGGDNLYQYAPNPLRWTDPLGLAYFAKRPLSGLLWFGPGSNNPIDDSFNTELSHEQLFFEDNEPDLPSNLGFFNDSTVREDDTSLLSGYRKMPQQYDDAIMRDAIENVEAMGDYKLFGNNCQTWAEKVREEYSRLYNNKIVTPKIQ